MAVNKALWMMGATLLLVGLSACGDEQNKQSDDEDASIQDTSLSREYDALVGEWLVVEYHQPGISAMSDEQAEQWLGARLRISDDWFALGEHYCETVAPVGEVLPVNQVLDGYRLQEGDFPLLDGYTQVARHHLDCDGQAWDRLGSVVLRVSESLALAPWDGVFFELQRDDGFRALGNEPAWNLAITAEGMRFSVPFDERDVSTPLPEPSEGASPGSRVYQVSTEGNYLRAVITPEACRDTMSGAPFEASVRVTRDGEVFTGCGGTMPTLEP